MIPQGMRGRPVEIGRLCLVAASLGLFSPCLTSGGTPAPASNAPLILLFHGSGTSPNDVAALETILNQNHLSYAATVIRAALNRTRLEHY